MRKEPFTILFANVGRRVALIRAFREAMRTLGLQGRILGVDANPLSPAYYVTDESFPICRIQQEEYIPALLEICRRQKVKLLISLLDTDLLKLAESRETFKQQGTFVLISSMEVVRLARNKQLTHDFFAKNGIPTPRILCYDAALEENTFPLFIKPLDGSASHMTFRIETRESLTFFHSYVPNPIIMEYVSGEEYTLDFFIDLDKVVKAIVPRKRLEVRAGEVSKSQIVLHPKIIAAGSTVAQALSYRGGLGMINIQCVYASDGNVKFIEINPRFGGGCPLSIHAGYPFPQWTMEMVLGRALSSLPINRGDGLTMLRYDDAVFIKQ
jgi:carbamoyl-phosphate synthase large subunit